MHAIYQFVKSTILGGLVVLLPLVAIGAFIAWTVETARKAVMPFLEFLPEKTIGGVSLAVLIVIAGIVACCFFAGLLAETALVRGLGRTAERFALSIPGYALMTNVGANMVGIQGKNAIKTVLIQLESSFQLGFLTDTLADGRHVVFVPGVPKALVGTLHIMTADRVQLLDLSIPSALEVLGRLGVGLGETWSADRSRGL